MAKHALEVVDWKPCERNTLRGFATIKIRELRLVVHDVALRERNGTRWAQLPGKPTLKDGKPITGDDGRIRYVPIFTTDRPGTRISIAARLARASFATALPPRAPRPFLPHS
jgi:hypothetical protein